jgi:hypothetical protein
VVFALFGRRRLVSPYDELSFRPRPLEETSNFFGFFDLEDTQTTISILHSSIVLPKWRFPSAKKIKKRITGDL